MQFLTKLRLLSELSVYKHNIFLGGIWTKCIFINLYITSKRKQAGCVPSRIICNIILELQRGDLLFSVQCLTYFSWHMMPDNAKTFISLLGTRRLHTYISLRIFLSSIFVCAFSVISLTKWMCVFKRIIIIKQEVWITSRCLGLGNKTMVCTVCLAMNGVML